MSEHFSKQVVKASAWCGQCHRFTLHAISNGNKGPCEVCLSDGKLHPRPEPEVRRPPARQAELPFPEVPKAYTA
jgi:hypothetical protein